jgi:hypothetical protein
MMEPNSGAAKAAFVELDRKLLRVTSFRMSSVCGQSSKLATLKRHHSEGDKHGDGR